MKKIIICILLFFLIDMQVRVLANITVPEGTEIMLVPLEKVTSKNARGNLKLKVKEDVVIDDVVVFKKNSKAFLKIVAAEPASAMGVAGVMEIYNGYLYDAKGNKREVLIDKKITGKEQIWAQVLFSMGLTIILCPLFLFGFVKGTNAKISPDNELEVMLKEEFVF